jgi:phosphoenolpyruvate-protein phosphotransferase (PTS system enzyme I)
MAAECVFVGTEASTGLVMNQAVKLAEFDISKITRSAGLPSDEKANANLAFQRTREQLTALMAGVDQTAADILEFQIELLSDFSATTVAAIDSGKSGSEAWIDCLDSEIASYLESGDEYLAARITDLTDLKNRVLKIMFGLDSTPCAFSAATPAILLAHDLTPTDFLSIEPAALAGIALVQGSPTSHVSILAKSRGIAMLVGCDRQIMDIPDGQQVILDSKAGQLIANPGILKLADFMTQKNANDKKAKLAGARVNEPAILPDGEKVRICANVDDVSLLREIDITPFDGIGLVRTEFMYSDTHCPTEEEQYAIYCAILAWADGRPVTFRTLDAGGDKPVKGLVVENEANPFLGIRGYRLSRMHPDIFSCQLRALARAAVIGPMKVMIPMITQPSEMDECRQIFTRVFEALSRESIAYAKPQLGMMIEVPSAALMAAQFDADFFSIGTNDLIQYTLAKARDNPSLGYLAEPSAAVLQLVSMSVSAAKAKNIDLSVCGDMASNEDGVKALLQAGVRSISIAPAQVARVKDIIRTWNM